MEINSNTNLEIERQKNLKATVSTLKSYLRYFARKWYIYLIALAICIGLAYYYFRKEPNSFVAVSTFVVDDPATSGMPTIPGGFLGGMIQGTNTSLFQGENLKWLYTTKLMLTKTLFSPNSYTKKLFINEFIQIDPTLKKASKGKKINFESTYDYSDIQKNAIVNAAVNSINKNYLRVADINSTGLAVKVEFSFPNEVFAKDFVEQLVSNVNSYYIRKKTKSKEEQVVDLENKVREYDRKLNTKISATAELIQAVPFPNPNLPTAQTSPQRTRVDVDLNTQLYTQSISALENAKVELAKLKPLITVVDSPILPLPNSKMKLNVLIIIAVLVSLMLVTVVLIIVHAYNRSMQLKYN